MPSNAAESAPRPAKPGRAPIGGQGSTEKPTVRRGRAFGRKNRDTAEKK